MHVHCIVYIDSSYRGVIAPVKRGRSFVSVARARDSVKLTWAFNQSNTNVYI